MPDTMKCFNCQEVLELPDTQTFVLDGGAKSVIVAEHGPAIVCRNCGAVYCKVIKGDETVVVTKIRQIAKGNPRVIIAGNGALDALKVN